MAVKAQVKAIDSKEKTESKKESQRTPTDLAKILLARHTQYVNSSGLWSKYHDCYQGRSMAQHIKRHLRESKASLQQRVKRAYYLNYCEPIVDLYTHYIFSKPAVRKENRDSISVSAATSETLPSFVTKTSNENTLKPQNEWETWLEDVNRKGDGISRFMSNATKYSLVYGHAYLLVDMPKTDKDIVTEKDRLDNNVTPYVVLLYPEDITNFSLDDRGKLIWVRIKESPPDTTDPFSPKKSEGKKSLLKNTTYIMGKENAGIEHLLEGEKEVYFKTWTRDGWFHHKVTKEGAFLIGQGTHPLGEVPVVPLYNSHLTKFPFYGSSLISDIADINVAILNWSSLIDEEIYQKCLNILCIQRSAGSDKEEIVIGSNNALEWDGTTPPFFLAPATDPGAFIQTQIDRMRDEIFRLAKLGGGLGLDLNTQRSGISHAYEFNETNRTIAEKADEVERAENEVHRLWFKWLGKTWDGIIDYPDTFSVESFDSELNLAMTSKDAVSSTTFHQEMEKRVVKKILHNVSSNITEQIFKEIEESGMMNNQEQQNQDQNVKEQAPVNKGTAGKQQGTPPVKQEV